MATEDAVDIHPGAVVRTIVVAWALRAASSQAAAYLRAAQLRDAYGRWFPSASKSTHNTRARRPSPLSIHFFHHRRCRPTRLSFLSTWPQRSPSRSQSTSSCPVLACSQPLSLSRYVLPLASPAQNNSYVAFHNFSNNPLNRPSR